MSLGEVIDVDNNPLYHQCGRIYNSRQESPVRLAELDLRMDGWLHSWRNKCSAFIINSTRFVPPRHGLMSRIRHIAGR